MYQFCVHLSPVPLTSGQEILGRHGKTRVDWLSIFLDTGMLSHIPTLME